MSEDPSSAADQPLMDPQRRGPWWRRVTSKMNKMKRRSSRMETSRATTPVVEASSSTAATRAIEPIALPADQVIPVRSDTATPDPAPVASASTPMPPSSLVMDAAALLAAETEDESEELLLPMLSSRTGVTQERARDLFSKYGMEYGSRSKQPATSEPPSKIRRVEKPVRLRVHWTCHECSRQFGMEKTCHVCGHRRCRDCTRHPSKRVREVLETTRRELELRDATVAEPATSETAPGVDLDLQRYQMEPSVPVAVQSQTPSSESEVGPNGIPRTQATPVAGTPSLSAPLELDDEADNEEVELPEIDFSIYTRPRAGMTAVLKPKAQIVRRQCHKCETQFLPPNRDECQECGHVRCDQCLRYPPKAASATSPPTVQAVQRVYRKPRQRVRYTCEHCNTLFLDSDRCFECGHERCNNCTREPPKRLHGQHDPAVIQAVADRLAAYGTGALGHPGVATLTD